MVHFLPIVTTQENTTATNDSFTTVNSTATIVTAEPGNATDLATTMAQNMSSPEASTGSVSNESTKAPTTSEPFATTETTDIAPEGCHQRFHAPSFLGGILLCGGIVSIIFVAVHFYRKRSDNRYHQF